MSVWQTTLAQCPHAWACADGRARWTQARPLLLIVVPSALPNPPAAPLPHSCRRPPERAGQRDAQAHGAGVFGVCGAQAGQGDAGRHVHGQRRRQVSPWHVVRSSHHLGCARTAGQRCHRSSPPPADHALRRAVLQGLLGRLWRPSHRLLCVTCAAPPCAHAPRAAAASASLAIRAPRCSPCCCRRQADPPVAAGQPLPPGGRQHRVHGQGGGGVGWGPSPWLAGIFSAKDDRWRLAARFPCAPRR